MKYKNTRLLNDFCLNNFRLRKNDFRLRKKRFCLRKFL